MNHRWRRPRSVRLPQARSWSVRGGYGGGVPRHLVRLRWVVVLPRDVLLWLMAWLDMRVLAGGAWGQVTYRVHARHLLMVIRGGGGGGGKTVIRHAILVLGSHCQILLKITTIRRKIWDWM